jgi:hypothetical protein
MGVDAMSVMDPRREEHSVAGLVERGEATPFPPVYAQQAAEMIEAAVLLLARGRVPPSSLPLARKAPSASLVAASTSDQ